MEWLIALAVLALIVRVVFFFIYPELDNALSGYDKETTENDHEHFNKQDGYDILSLKKLNLYIKSRAKTGFLYT